MEERWKSCGVVEEEEGSFFFKVVWIVEIVED